MKCLDPQRIRNKYTGQWMYVPCRKCDACRIAAANSKAHFLQKELEKYDTKYFVTLTYSNDHIPFVAEQSNIVCRMSSPVYDDNDCHRLSYKVCDYPDMLDVLTDVYTPTFDDVPIKGHVMSDVIGVLHYKDLQDFFKRLRYNLNGQKFIYFACGEYGDTTKRPHYHVVICFPKSIDFDGFSSSVVKSWPLCDWSRLDLQQCVKFATSGISGYLASYVNCAAHQCPFLQNKTIRQKTIRSKSVDFGTDSEDEKAISQYVLSFLNPQSIRGYIKPLQVPKRYKDFAFSAQPISPRVFYTYFRKPSGCDKILAESFGRRCRKVYQYFKRGGRYIQELGDANLVKSTDYLYWLSYRKFCNKFNINPQSSVAHEEYIRINLSAQTTYASLLLKSQMMSYRPEQSVDYYTELCNTFVDEPYSQVSMYRKHLLGVGESLLSNRERMSVIDYVRQYKHKLVSKHYQKSVYA